jgi:hypothetical protein
VTAHLLTPDSFQKRKLVPFGLKKSQKNCENLRKNCLKLGIGAVRTIYGTGSNTGHTAYGSLQYSKIWRPTWLHGMVQT